MGQLLSVNSIVKYLKSQGEKSSFEIVSNYLLYLCNALMIESIPRYDVQGKHLLDHKGKYYFSDHGMRNLLSGFDIRGSIEKVMESVVRHHLLSQGYEVYVGVLGDKEVDFVAIKDNEKIYVQVTCLLASEQTEKREFGNLWDINDNYPKYVVSLDPIAGENPNYPGIKHLTLRRFLNKG